MYDLSEGDVMNILVVAAHADDEVLGCGGTIAKYKDQGASVNVAILADGVSSRSTEDISSNKDLKIRNVRPSEDLIIEFINWKIE